MKLVIGSRGSKLAVTQTEWVAAEIKKKNPAVDISFRQITTAGDRDMSPTLQASGGKGVFVKEIEEALLAKEIDLAIHSLKDVPQALPSGLTLGPCPKREDFRDAFISRFGEQLNELPRGSTIGTSSPRRQAQVARVFAKRQYRIEPLRGNVETRLKKLQEGKYDGIILAVAGLKRLGLESEITHILNPDVILPSPAQGCLGLEYREGDAKVLALLESIKDIEATVTARAERAFLQGLGGDCFVPVGAYSTIQAGVLKMKSVLLDPAGKSEARTEWEGPSSEPELVGFQLAERLLFDGGSALMNAKAAT